MPYKMVCVLESFLLTYSNWDGDMYKSLLCVQCIYSSIPYLIHR